MLYRDYCAAFLIFFMKFEKFPSDLPETTMNVLVVKTVFLKNLLLWFYNIFQSYFDKRKKLTGKKIMLKLNILKINREV